MLVQVVTVLLFQVASARARESFHSRPPVPLTQSQFLEIGVGLELQSQFAVELQSRLANKLLGAVKHAGTLEDESEFSVSLGMLLMTSPQASTCSALQVLELGAGKSPVFTADRISKHMFADFPPRVEVTLADHDHPTLERLKAFEAHAQTDRVTVAIADMDNKALPRLADEYDLIFMKRGMCFCKENLDFVEMGGYIFCEGVDHMAGCGEISINATPQFLSDIFRMLKPGGIAVLLDPLFFASHDRQLPHDDLRPSPEEKFRNYLQDFLQDLNIAGKILMITNKEGQYDVVEEISVCDNPALLSLIVFQKPV